MSNTAKTREDEAARGSTPSNVTVIPAPVTPPRKKRRSRRPWIFALLVLAVVGTGSMPGAARGRRRPPP